MKNIAVTGASGFVGSYLVRTLKDLIIDELDLLTLSVEEIDFSKYDTIIHLAALVHQMKGAEDELYYKINRDLAFNVATKAKAQGVKQFLFMSTAKVFGESSDKGFSYDESSQCNPFDSYSKSKFEAEKLINSLCDDEFKVAIIRTPLVYGPGVRGNMLSLMNLIDKCPILPLNEINNARSIVFIGNLVALINRIIEKNVSGVFIAGDKFPLTTTELIKIIIKSMKKKRILFKLPKWMLNLILKVKPALSNRLFGSFVLDHSDTNKRLDFSPPYDSEDGILEMVNWYKYS
jgi:UDP-glucose 4-epimerase